MLPIREVARLIILDAHESILLVRYDSQTNGSSYWVPPGGALELGEDHRATAERELLEETGLSADIGAELWERRFDFAMSSETVHQIERYFLVRLTEVAPSAHNSSPESIVEHRWWRRDDLMDTNETIYPKGFALDLGRVLDSVEEQ